MRRPSNLLCAGALAIAAAVVPAAPASAGPGDLDPTFGGDGIVDLRWEDGPSSGTLYSPRVDVGPRGAIWTASTTLQPDSDFRARVLVTKLRPDGSLDEAFAGSGQREWYLRRTGTAPSAPYSAARAVAALPTGGVQVSGVWTNEQAPVDRPRLFVLRLTKFGGGDGLAVMRRLPIEPLDKVHAAVGSDGSVVVAGYAGRELGEPATYVARFGPDGSVDRRFGDRGAVVDPAQGLWPVGDVVVDRSGRTLVGTFQRGREDVLNVLRLQ